MLIIGKIYYVSIVFGMVTCRLLIRFLHNLQNNKSLSGVLTGSHSNA